MHLCIFKVQECKSGWIEKTLAHDPKKLIRKAVQDPRRALNALKAIVKKRVR